MHFEPWWTLAGVSACVHPLLGLGGGWGQNVTKRYLTYSGNNTTIKKRDDDWDTYSDNEMLMNSETKWARFVYSRIREWRSASAKVVSFCNSESFSGYCRTLKNIKRLRDGSFLVECGKRAPAQNLLQTNRFIDRPVKVSIHKTPNSSLGVIRCRDLADMSEAEIRDELKDQGVVGVNRVTVKKEGKVIPTNTLFLTFGSPDLPKEITVGYLKVKVALFVPNPMRCFNCNKFGHTGQSCKVAAKCPGCGKDKHEGRCEKRISFPEARHEAKMPTVVSGGKTYAAAAFTRRELKSVECQTSLTCFLFCFFERAPRSTESNVRSSGFRSSPLSVPRRQIGVQPIPLTGFLDWLDKAYIYEKRFQVCVLPTSYDCLKKKSEYT